MRHNAPAIAALVLTLAAAGSGFAAAQAPADTLVVAGPRTPESLDQEYPPTEATHEARRNVYERLLAYGEKTGPGGVRLEDFGRIEGRLAERYDLAPDKTSITFHLRRGVTSASGNPLTADDVMWTFERGWNLKATFHWYMTQVLKVSDPGKAFHKIDDETVKVSLPQPSPLLDRLWVNNDLGILDAVEMKKHLTADDPWGSRWLASHSASFAPYSVTQFLPGQMVVYQANPHYYRGPPALKRIVFREMPNSSNRTASIEGGAIDVAEWLQPRELNLLKNVPGVQIWMVFGNYIQRIEMNNTMKPFSDARVRQALNYLVPRDEILKSVFFDTARPTRSPISEIYPGYTANFSHYADDVARAKSLLAAAGYPNGFRTTLGYRTGEEIEEEIAVILKSAFARAGVELELDKLPASTLVERYTKGQMPMYFFRDMAIVPDAAYVANLWLNSASLIDYSRFRNDEVDRLIDRALTQTDETERLSEMRRVQQITMEQAPWVFLFNPGYQLATRSNVHGYSWYTPNGNSWYDFSKTAP